MQPAPFGNDQQLIRRFESDAGRPLRIETSPLAAALSGYLESVDSKDGKIRLSFEPDATFSQLPGVLQGGSVATMLDFAMSFAALAVIDDRQRVTTTSLAVTYLRSARIGRFSAVGEVERRGRSVVFTRAQLWDGDERLVASAMSTLAVLT